MMQSDIWAASMTACLLMRSNVLRIVNADMDVLALFCFCFMKKAGIGRLRKSRLCRTATPTASQATSDLFSAESQWLEILWFPERIHEDFADYRRVARVFVKPVSPPVDKIAFLNGLRQANDIPERLRPPSPW